VVADEARVALHDDPTEVANGGGDVGMVAGWDGARVEEAAGIIEFDF